MVTGGGVDEVVGGGGALDVATDVEVAVNCQYWVQEHGRRLQQQLYEYYCVEQKHFSPPNKTVSYCRTSVDVDGLRLF